MAMKKSFAKLKSKGYRDGLVNAELKNGLPAQVKALRTARRWSQDELAERSGMKQARISAIEGSAGGVLNLTTLQRLASAFDVALLVRFAAFSEFARWVESFSPEDFAVPSFSDEPATAYATLSQSSDPAREMVGMPPLEDLMSLSKRLESQFGDLLSLSEHVEEAPRKTTASLDLAGLWKRSQGVVLIEAKAQKQPRGFYELAAGGRSVRLNQPQLPAVEAA